MILVDTEDEKINKYEDEIYDRAFDMELKYGIVISPIIKNRQFFEYWSDTLPFYRNIKKEGGKGSMTEKQKDLCIYSRVCEKWKDGVGNAAEA